MRSLLHNIAGLKFASLCSAKQKPATINIAGNKSCSSKKSRLQNKIRTACNKINSLSKNHATLSTSILSLLLILSLNADHLYGAAEGNRKITIYNIHTKQTLSITYKKDGQYIPSAMKKINHIMGDWRRKESRVMNPDLIDLMWEMHTQLGSKKPIHLVSGYRSAKTNNSLRSKGGGQAKRSRHILGMAADVHFPDIPVRELRDSALIRQRGGVGYYPTSGLPFVHMDVGRVRHWPRISRPQLASLFPSGYSKHVPSDGRPLNKSDAKKYGALAYVTKLQKIQLARRISRDKSQGVAVASLTPTPPLLKNNRPQYKPEPEIASQERNALNQKLAALEKSANQGDSNRKNLRPTITKDQVEFSNYPNTETPAKITPPNTRNQSDWWRGQTIAGLDPLKTKLEEEKQLVQLASIDTSTPESWQSFTPPSKPKLIEEANVAYSPEVDDEHPDELNYRPFSLSPLMTDRPIADDVNLAKLSPPDYAETSVILQEGQTIESSQFRPGLQHAHLIYANQFVGSAITDITQPEPPAPTVSTPQPNVKRTVKRKYRPKKVIKKSIPKEKSIFGIF